MSRTRNPDRLPRVDRYRVPKPMWLTDAITGERFGLRLVIGELVICFAGFPTVGAYLFRSRGAIHVSWAI